MVSRLPSIILNVLPIGETMDLDAIVYIVKTLRSRSFLFGCLE